MARHSSDAATVTDRAGCARRRRAGWVCGPPPGPLSGHFELCIGLGTVAAQETTAAASAIIIRISVSAFTGRG
jgi:hypothetical protein